MLKEPCLDLQGQFSNLTWSPATSGNVWAQCQMTYSWLMSPHWSQGSVISHTGCGEGCAVYQATHRETVDRIWQTSVQRVFFLNCVTMKFLLKKNVHSSDTRWKPTGILRTPHAERGECIRPRPLRGRVFGSHFYSSLEVFIFFGQSFLC